jgi:hypothetical protein
VSPNWCALNWLLQVGDATKAACIYTRAHTKFAVSEVPFGKGARNWNRRG